MATRTARRERFVVSTPATPLGRCPATTVQVMTVEESVKNMVKEIRRHGYTDFSHPRYYNIEWMKLLEETVEIVARHGYVLSKPEWDPPSGSVGYAPSTESSSG